MPPWRGSVAPHPSEQTTASRQSTLTRDTLQRTRWVVSVAEILHNQCSQAWQRWRQRDKIGDMTAGEEWEHGEWEEPLNYPSVQAVSGPGP